MHGWLTSRLTDAPGGLKPAVDFTDRRIREAPVVRQRKIGGNGDSRPRYKQHRAVDDKTGVITAVETTPGDVAEPWESNFSRDENIAAPQPAQR